MDDIVEDFTGLGTSIDEINGFVGKYGNFDANNMYEQITGTVLKSVDNIVGTKLADLNGAISASSGILLAVMAFLVAKKVLGGIIKIFGFAVCGIIVYFVLTGTVSTNLLDNFRDLVGLNGGF